MLLPARSPTPQVLPEPLGVSVNFLSKEGVLSSSNILRVWNNQLKEYGHPGRPAQAAYKGSYLVSGPRGFKVSTPGRSRAKTQALGRSGSASVACTKQAFRGHLGNIQGWRGKGHLGPSRSRRGRTLHGVRQAMKTRINSLHCTLVVNTLICLF